MIVLNIIYVVICVVCLVGVGIVLYEWLTGKAKWSNDNKVDGEW